LKIRVRLIDADPGREFEKAADLSVFLERRAVIDEKFAAPRVVGALIGKIPGL